MIWPLCLNPKIQIDYPTNRQRKALQNARLFFRAPLLGEMLQPFSLFKLKAFCHSGMKLVIPIIGSE